MDNVDINEFRSIQSEKKNKLALPSWQVSKRMLPLALSSWWMSFRSRAALNPLNQISIEKKQERVASFYFCMQITLR